MTATVTRPAQPHQRPSGTSLTGTGTLLRFMIRRDRIRLPLWILAITVFTVASVAALPDLYPGAADRQARATLVQNPGLRAISGPATASTTTPSAP